MHAALVAQRSLHLHSARPPDGPAAAPAAPAAPQQPTSRDAKQTDERLAALERELIIAALDRTGGNRSQAARLLEISSKALRYKIRDYRIE